MTPEWIAATATSLITAGVSLSGNPCPRFTASKAIARCVISVKIDVPKPVMRVTRGEAMTPP